ncbi:MAG: M13 family metallopeptidase [Crocinitomicaceae bacterium]|nr:M13 family metallopeptidase [Crocinitomicaceae bacterium]
MKTLHVFATSTLLFGLHSCGVNSVETTDENAQSVISIDPNLMDTTIRPQNDFFMFANGIWIKNTEIPASESRWGSFNELDQNNKEKLTTILEAAVEANADKGSATQLIGDYYASFINMEQRNAVGATFIAEKLDKVNAINSKDGLLNHMANDYIKGISTFFSFGVGQDLKDVENNTVYFSQGGLGLPNRDYYFDETKEDIRTKYIAHLQASFELAGQEDAAAKAQEIFEFEKTLASKMMKPAELRVPENTYNKYNRADFLGMLKPFDFETFLVSIECESFDSIIVGQPEYVQHIAALYDKTSLETLKNYTAWKTINNYAGHLNEAFVQLNFDFYKGVLSGTREMKPINERAIDEITGQPINEALGQAFVAEHFSVEAKDKINRMVDDLLAVYRERINELEWMTDETKKQALTKLEAIGRKLGYPDKWEDLSIIDIKADNYLYNIDQCAMHSVRDNLSDLHRPVDKDEWGMPAHMVNAYYHPLLNEIAFPAGIMQYPFFDINVEDAVNYGGIGMVIGHEFTHGFDDMGSKFAADGSFTNWWTEIDRENFEQRTQKLGATFSGFCPIDGHCVNPDLTMGENIADLGGITMAYYAYTRTQEFKKGEIINGFTPAQRFFIAYAQLWKIKYTDEELKKRIATDPHSPGMYRVNGPLMNCPEFFEAFDVKEGDPMRNSEDVISKIW